VERMAARTAHPMTHPTSRTPETMPPQTTPPQTTPRPRPPMLQRTRHESPRPAVSSRARDPVFATTSRAALAYAGCVRARVVAVVLVTRHHVAGSIVEDLDPVLAGGPFQPLHEARLFHVRWPRSLVRPVEDLANPPTWRRIEVGAAAIRVECRDREP